MNLQPRPSSLSAWVAVRRLATSAAASEQRNETVQPKWRPNILAQSPPRQAVLDSEVRTAHRCLTAASSRVALGGRPFEERNLSAGVLSFESPPLSATRESRIPQLEDWSHSQAVSEIPFTTSKRTDPDPNNCFTMEFASERHLCHLVSPRKLAPPQFLVEAVAGLKAGHLPQLIEDCCTGAYFLRDAQGVPCAIFKPCEEEAGAASNPKGNVGDKWDVVSPTAGVEVGGASGREVGAFLLDQGHASVPVTVTLRLVCRSEGDTITRTGSAQQFAQSECTSEDVGASRLPERDVQAIAILDIRLFNADRHEGNILVQRSSPAWDDVSLIPIDHGFCLPAFHTLGSPTLCWLNWPQTLRPLSQDTVDYIMSLDPKADEEALRQAVKLPASCLRTLHIGTVLLQEGVAAGRTLQEIGHLTQRPLDDSPSPLEEDIAATLSDIGATSEQGSDAEASWDLDEFTRAFRSRLQMRPGWEKATCC